MYNLNIVILKIEFAVLITLENYLNKIKYLKNLYYYINLIKKKIYIL